MKAILLAAGLSLAASGAMADSLVREFSGSGTSTTRPFKVEGPWEIQWDLDCAAPLKIGNDSANLCMFMIFVYTSDGGFVAIDGAQDTSGRGASYKPDAGTYYLDVTSAQAKWEIKVVRVD